MSGDIQTYIMNNIGQSEEQIEYSVRALMLYPAKRCIADSLSVTFGITVWYFRGVTTATNSAVRPLIHFVSEIHMASSLVAVIPCITGIVRVAKINAKRNRPVVLTGLKIGHIPIGDDHDLSDLVTKRTCQV